MATMHRMTLHRLTPSRHATFEAQRWLSTTVTAGREPLLFTPGPLTTSLTVKQAMQVDLGSRDPVMVELIAHIRRELLALANVSQASGWECVLLPGSGTFAVESVVTSVISPAASGGRLLVCSNGAYGDRMVSMCNVAGVAAEVVRGHEAEALRPDAVVTALASAKEAGRPFTHVGCVHHETTAGTLNPIHDIGTAIHEFDPSVTFIVDSMSGFGAYDLTLKESHISFMVSSANKNIEGVPGFAFALCDRAKLIEQGVHARSLSLDLLAQWDGLEKNGQFRFTPPTHALLAFNQVCVWYECA